MIVFSKKSDRFFHYVSSQFNKEFSKSKDFMPIKGIVEAKLYFEKPEEEAKFVIQNPNAKTTCGCGESFTV